METKDRPNLSEIREKLRRQTNIDVHRKYLICDTVPEGIPRGVICEIIGSARTEWVLRLLKQNPSLSTFWAEEKLTILPTAIHQRGINLTQILLAETGDLLFQTLRKALRSKLFDCIILPGAIHEIRMLKALQLFARESNATVFFLSKTQKTAWAIPFQLQAEWSSESDAILTHILKTKFSQTIEVCE